MKLFTGLKLSKREKVFLLSICVISILLFIYFLQKNMHVSYFDETGYLEISSKILEEGIFHIKEPLRTYMYPLIIAAFRLLSPENETYSKVLVSILQYIIYIITIILIASEGWKIRSNKLVIYTIFTLGALNPYMVQSTTLYLTDLLSSCFIIISIIFAASYNLTKGVNIFISVGLLFVNIMIRPSNAIFFPAVFVVLLFRLYKKEFLLNLKTISAGFAPLIFIFPQLYNNVVYFNKWTPLIVQKLYTAQATWGAQFLKYATVIRSGENPQLFYQNPYYPYGNTITIFQLIFENFGLFIFTVCAHIFAVLDWGYVDTYITEYYPVSRIFGSVFLYFSWLMILIGIGGWLKGLYKTYILKSSTPFGGLVIFSFFITAFLYLSFISTTLVESRFGYPIFLLLLVFAGWGVEYLYQSIQSSKTHGKKGIKVISYSFIFILLVFILLSFSFKLDGLTGRINWQNGFLYFPNFNS